MFEALGSTRAPYEEIEPRSIATYELRDGKLDIRDPVWGHEVIGNQPGDEVLLELLHVDLVRRSMAIEQLTLDPATATIPGTASFSRWEHIWGSVVFARKMTADMNLDPRERLILQLRTFVSDLGHTAYSHLGDWMFQGSGGPEDQHDDELMALLELSGVNDVLRSHEIEPAEVIFPDGEDWIECGSPELCVDRVDYGVREIQRWLDLNPGSFARLDKNAFRVVDGRLVMTSQQVATQFAKSFLLLASEHWSEPLHRLQLKIQEELVRDVISNDYTNTLAINPADIGSYHPRDVLFTADGDITREMHVTGTLGRLLRPVMKDIGAAKRRIFVEERRDQLATFLRADTADYPHPLEHYADYKHRYGKLPLLPAFVSLIPVGAANDLPDFEQNPNALDFFLPALKPRRVDPPFIAENGDIRTLSEVDPNFSALGEQQANILRQAYVGRLHMNQETKNEITNLIKDVEVEWQESLHRPHMPEQVMRDMLHNSVTVAAAYRMIDVWLP